MPESPADLRAEGFPLCPLEQFDAQVPLPCTLRDEDVSATQALMQLFCHTHRIGMALDLFGAIKDQATPGSRNHVDRCLLHRGLALREAGSEKVQGGE